MARSIRWAWGATGRSSIITGWGMVAPAVVEAGCGADTVVGDTDRVTPFVGAADVADSGPSRVVADPPSVLSLQACVPRVIAPMSSSRPSPGSLAFAGAPSSHIVNSSARPE